jgi:ATP-dependent RNA helicase RhlE
VLNYELPNVPETYVHRIGRTGRAGAEGTAFSFCDWSEKSFLTDIQKLIQKQIPVVKDHPFDIASMHSNTAVSTIPAGGAFHNFQNARSGGRRGGKVFAQR